eukprot:c23177_g1_i1 orf=387-2309(-)
MGSPKAPYSTTKMIAATLSSAVVLFLVVVIACTSLISWSGARPLNAHIHAQTAYSSSVITSPESSAHVPPSIALICNNTVYPQACLTGFTSQSSPPRSELNNASPQKLLSIALKAALAVVHESHSFARNCSKFNGNGPQGLHRLERQAIEDCEEMMERATDQLNLAIANLSSITMSTNAAEKTDALLNLNVWLSASLSFQTTCSDGFQFVSYGKCEKAMLKRQEQVAQVLVNSLDIVKKVFKHGRNRGGGGAPHRHLLAAEGPYNSDHVDVHVNQITDGFPGWLSSSERKLLQAPIISTSTPTAHAQAPAPTPPVHHVYADMVVAADGSGDYLKITDALNHIPAMRPAGQRFVVYIKEGVYEEIVTVPSNLVNLTFVGDGIGNTIITGNNSVGSGLFNTLRTATVGISGEGFMARDMTFRNTAGPEGYQAVALRGSADYLVFYRCSFEGYQDTLYALASRHFYRDCIIQGTVDFIFGNAIASFQSCSLLAGRPLKGQQNTMTAQGRKIDLDISGFSFQNCTLAAAPELVSSPFPVSSYLGRPWKAFSRTVFLQSFMDSLIHPAGWLAWNSSNPFTDTLYYGEFQNRGPGSRIDQRVPWTGVHPVMNASDAALFTAEEFILGSAWLPLSQLAYTSGLAVTP